MALGETYTAAAIYSFYRTCRLVVIKKRKEAQGQRGAPGSASVTGITGSALQATAIRTQYANAKNKDLLVDDYVKFNNFSDDYVKSLTKERLVDDAIHFVNRLLLQDLRPPWLQQDFPQALPGDGVLSKCTRPSFLQWNANEAARLFGKEVHGRLAWLSESVSLIFAGIIARPLYACTELVDPWAHKLCMNVASMSRFLQQPAGRPHYKCSTCSQKAESVEEGPSLRILWAYPLVEGIDGKPTPLRVSSPVRLVVHAPPPEWGWGSRPGTVSTDRTKANPGRSAATPRHYWYNEAESAQIWRDSWSYEAKDVFVD